MTFKNIRCVRSLTHLFLEKPFIKNQSSDRLPRKILLLSQLTARKIEVYLFQFHTGVFAPDKMR